MRNTLKWGRVAINFCFAIVMLVCALNYKTSVYLVYQAKGQLSILFNTRSLQEYAEKKGLSQLEKENIRLVEQIKTYSIDSLGYAPTNNFNTVFDQENAAILWVVTACERYAITPYEWTFPIVGKVSYKGFFKEELAQKEYNHLAALGYDVDIRSVTAWSTLGWFNDPLLSSTLKRSRGGLCNLLFHELFHATYYAAGEVDRNENLANFIAHKATLRFLRNDPAELKAYQASYSDNIVFNTYMLRQTEQLKAFYKKTERDPAKYVLKLRAIYYVADSIDRLPLHNKKRFLSRKQDVLESKNAYLIDFQQYDRMQDSLEKVFNKFYGGSIKKLVQDLRSN